MRGLDQTAHRSDRRRCQSLNRPGRGIAFHTGPIRPVRSVAPSPLFAHQPFEELLGLLALHDAIVGLPQRLHLAGRVGVGLRVERVLDQGHADRVPHLDRVDRPLDAMPVPVLREQRAERAEDRHDVSRGHVIVNGLLREESLRLPIPLLHAAEVAEVALLQSDRELVVLELARHVLLDPLVQGHEVGKHLGKLQVDVVLRWVRPVLGVVVVPFLPVVLEHRGLAGVRGGRYRQGVLEAVDVERVHELEELRDRRGLPAVVVLVRDVVAVGLVRDGLLDEVEAVLQVEQRDVADLHGRVARVGQGRDVEVLADEDLELDELVDVGRDGVAAVHDRPVRVAAVEDAVARRVVVEIEIHHAVRRVEPHALCEDDDAAVVDVEVRVRAGHGVKELLRRHRLHVGLAGVHIGRDVRRQVAHVDPDEIRRHAGIRRRLHGAHGVDMESFLHGWFPFSKEPEAGLLIGRHLSSFDEDGYHHIQATVFHNGTLVVF